MSITRVIQVAQQLHQQGKTPSVALLKARLGKEVPLAQIIAGLKCWKESPDAVSTLSELPSVQQADTSGEELIREIRELKQQLEEMKALLKKLQSS